MSNLLKSLLALFCAKVHYDRVAAAAAAGGGGAATAAASRRGVAGISHNKTMTYIGPVTPVI